MQQATVRNAHIVVIDVQILAVDIKQRAGLLWATVVNMKKNVVKLLMVVRMLAVQMNYLCPTAIFCDSGYHSSYAGWPNGYCCCLKCKYTCSWRI